MQSSGPGRKYLLKVELPCVKLLRTTQPLVVTLEPTRRSQREAAYSPISDTASACDPRRTSSLAQVQGWIANQTPVARKREKVERNKSNRRPAGLLYPKSANAPTCHSMQVIAKPRIKTGCRTAEEPSGTGRSMRHARCF